MQQLSAYRQTYIFSFSSDIQRSQVKHEKHDIFTDFVVAHQFLFLLYWKFKSILGKFHNLGLSALKKNHCMFGFTVFRFGFIVFLLYFLMVSFALK